MASDNTALPNRPDGQLGERLARLDPSQLSSLVLGLQQRIDELRAVSARQHAPIAIIGLACRFPGAPDAQAFAALQKAEASAIGPPPADRPNAEDLPPAGYIAGIDRFDADFFGIRPGEAAAMDPQHRMLLEESWHALEDAGYAAAERRPDATGVFFGLATSDYEVRFRGDSGHAITPAVATGTSRSVAAGRIAHLLGITGPALVLDTACSSSLVAVHQAVAALRSGSCRMALAGGANALLEADLSRGFEQAGMLSPTHACRTFDAAADGYVRGEGCGLVVLKLLDDALRDGDTIRAVIRGSAVNHDGHASAITAPNGSAQTALIRAALTDASLEPSEVQVVECHGTGTALGDPIEAAALAEAYGPGRSTPLLLGAVKSNIGHLEAAAGVAGLIRLVLALEAGNLPPMLHQQQLNPRIDWKRLPLRIASGAAPWPEVPFRRAGVSSFGFSGTNAHLILEAAPAVPPKEPTFASAPSETPGKPLALLPLSAPDEAGLARLAEATAAHLQASPKAGSCDLYALARSFAFARPHHRQRAAVAFDDMEEVANNLRLLASGSPPLSCAVGEAHSATPRIAFLFTGQGSQWRGMGRDLYESDDGFRAVVDRCAARLDKLLGLSLLPVMFGADEAEDLDDTRIAQPALFVLEYALAEWLESRGVVPDMVLGHSLGEWVAACRAGVITLEDALVAIAARGRLMGELPRNGAMAAVFSDQDVVAELVAAGGDLVDIAAINTPDEVVVSGDSAAVAALCKAAEDRGIGSQTLRVSHAFHSRLMAPAAEGFADALAGLSLSPPRIPLISNLTGTAEAPFADPNYWVQHLRAPVRFAQGITAAVEAGAEVLVEIGPSPLLIGMARRVPEAERSGLSWIPTLRRGRPARSAMAGTLAQLYTAGIKLRWDAILPPGPLGQAPLYPFADTRHWIERHRLAGQGIVSALSRSAAEPVTRAAPVSGEDAGSGAQSDGGEAVAALLARSLQLSLEQIAEDRTFLEYGVDSLALSEAVAAIEKRWPVRIPRQALFETLTTPARLLAHVHSAAAQVTAVPEVTTTAAPQPQTPVVEVPVGGAQIAETRAAAPAAVEDARAQAYLAGFARDYVARSRGSRELRETYGRVLADSRASAGFRPETKRLLYPIAGARGHGAQMTDVDGNEYVDITMGFGVQLFGHSPSFVVEAIQRQLEGNGLYIGPQAPLAGEVAAAITRLTATDRAVFCNSGTEAVMTALRVARQATGRRKVAMFAGSYHGHFDATLGRASADGTLPAAGGTPPGMVADMVILDYGDPEESLRVLQELGQELAAVLVEPVQSRNPGLQPRDFLKQLRRFTSEAGIALIFDEVLLGFRVAMGGAQAWAGVAADLVTYGKIVGGGLPIGVLAGTRRYLDTIDGGAWSFEGTEGPQDERTFFAGTFNKNPLAMTAALAVLTRLEAEGPALQEGLNERTTALAGRLDSLLREEGAPIRIQHFSSFFRFSGASDVFYYHLLRNGLYVWEGRTCFLSTAHSDADLERIAEAVRTSLRAMQKGALLPTGKIGGDEQILPLTPGQEALWVLAAFSPETASAYNQSAVLTLEGPCEEAALSEAVHAVARRHDALRTTFAADGASQRVHHELVPDFVSIDLSQEGEAAFRDCLRQEAGKPFDLEKGPPLRVRLIRLGAQSHRLVILQPHILTDGWSMQLIAQELGALYSAKITASTAALPPPAPLSSYVAHAIAQAEDPAARLYWLETFRDPPPPLELPLARPRPALQSYAGALRQRRLPASLLTRAEAKARAAGCSLFALCLAAYARLLARLGDQEDLALAIFSAGQPEIGERRLAGYCTATLPLRLRKAGSLAGSALLETVQAAISEARAHRGYPFAQLVRALNLKRDPSRSPLTSVSFNLDRLDAEPRFEGLRIGLEANTHGSVRWDLNWNMLCDAEGLLIEAHYNRDLFDADQLDDWLRDYAELLEALIDEEDSVAAMAGPPMVESLATRVHAHARKTPAAIALRDPDRSLSYADLDQEAAALAAQLQSCGAGHGDVVAFLLPRGVGPVVAMLAAGRLGAAFLPLDPDQPPAHHARLLSDSRARVLIASPSADASGMKLPVLVWSSDLNQESGGAPKTITVTAREPAEVTADDLAYILYTSGSTGVPKGVRVGCGGLAAYTQALLRRLGLDGPTSFAIVTSFAADLGYSSVLGALWSGGTLHVADADMARDCEALGDFFAGAAVDCLKIVPSHFAALLEGPHAARLLPRRALIFGGDLLTWALVERTRSLDGSCRIFNHYGPTETTIGATMIEVTQELRDRMKDRPDDLVPIGPSLEGYEVTLVDPGGQPVPHGIEGEICISGVAVAFGYTRPEDEHSAVGLPRFFRDAKGRRSYRSGDLATMASDGIISFRGRGDDMVKIRGHRIEPAGLEALLKGHEAVRDAVVLVERPPMGEPRILAAAATSLDEATLSAWLAEQVPAAMRPARLLVCESLPLTTNGKIDRAALRSRLVTSAEPASSAKQTTAEVGGSDPLDLLQRIWQLSLGCGPIGPDDDFFALGGDSIVAIQVVGKARAEGLRITPAQIFAEPTPRRLSALAEPVETAVKGQSEVAGSLPLTPIQAWFCALEVPQRNRWCLTALFEAPAGTTDALLTEALAALVEHHDALRIRLLDEGARPQQKLVARGAGPAPAVLLHEAGAAEGEGEALARAEDELCDMMMERLDIAQGPVLAGGLLLREGRKTRLAIAVHHLVFDMVSWSILAEDLGALLAGMKPQPPTTRWSWWSAAEADRVAAVEGELDYWRALEAEAGPASSTPTGREAEAGTATLTLDAAATERLLNSANTAYGLQRHEALLAAVAHALLAWTGGPSLALDLESHGRETFDPAIDLSRTLGWFTVHYPLVLSGEARADLQTWLVSLKERLRAVPNRGIGYGLLRQQPDSGLSLDPEVSFNFVGDLAQFGDESLRLLRLGAGRERDPDAARPHRLSFNAWMEKGALTLACQYGRGDETAEIERLLADTREAIAQITEHCAAVEATVYTPSDFSDIDFSQDELDALMADLTTP